MSDVLSVELSQEDEWYESSRMMSCLNLESKTHGYEDSQCPKRLILAEYASLIAW